MRAARYVVGLIAVSTLVAGCGGGGGGAPDVTGAPASDSATLFKASNLQKVLSKVNSLLGGGQVTAVKIEPRDVKAVGQTRTVTVDYNNNSFAVNTPSIPSVAAFDPSSVNPAGVQKAVSAVESKAGVKQSGISYVAVTRTPDTSKPFLLIYLRGSTDFYRASIAGTHVRVSKGSSGTSGAAPPSVPSAPTGGASPSIPSGGGSSVANCLAKAGNDPAKMRACVGQ